MVKTASKEEVSVSSNGTKKQRKKQARQEAKTMLKLEQANKNEQKAAKKLTKMQEKLEAYRMQKHKFEAKLSEMRSSHHEPAAEVVEAKPEAEESEQSSAENPSSSAVDLEPAAELVEAKSEAGNLSNSAEEENSSSENHAHISNPSDIQESALSEQEGHVDVAHEQATAYPVVEEHPDINPGQGTVPSADDFTYIPASSQQETSFVEEGQ